MRITLRHQTRQAKVREAPARRGLGILSMIPSLGHCRSQEPWRMSRTKSQEPGKRESGNKEAGVRNHGAWESGNKGNDGNKGKRGVGKKSASKEGQESGNTRHVVNASHTCSQGSHVSLAASGLHVPCSFRGLPDTRSSDPSCLVVGLRSVPCGPGLFLWVDRSRHPGNGAS